MIEQNDLINQIRAYKPDFDSAIVSRAYDYAKKMHDGQTRASGEPYYTHPVEVASILASMKMDTGTIVTAILHDTLEDTEATYEDLKKTFGVEVADLVNGVSKLTRIESQTVEGKQAENFRKLLLAMSEDIRVLLVKLADRLHNMRTMGGLAPEKQRRIALETLEIYAPLAERIGVHQIKEELEDLCFGILNPEARASLAKRLSFLRSEGTGVVDNIIGELQKLFKEAGISAEITGREKTRYSIWKKMQRKNVAFEQLSDVMAFRVVVGKVEECYNVLGILHSRYPSVPGRFKDYISTPKPNGYRSIHTTVMGPEQQRIEVQIRTRDMHNEADLGVAAHWAYKEGEEAPSLKDVRKYRWLRELLEILEQEQRPEDFWENTKLELFQEQVYVFSPKGDLIELPSGATPVDFAYAIHSDVGDKCVGAKINSRIAPLNTKLSNGDQVDIITAKTQTPSPTWERFVVTGKARSHIRKFIRNQQRNEYITLGKAMLQKIFRQEGYEFTDKAVGNVLKNYKAQESDDVYAGIGSGLIVARDVFRAIFPAHKTEIAKRPSSEMDHAAMLRPQAKGKDRPMPIKGLIPGMAMHFARCCHPLPGDRIVGIVTTGKGVTIHTIDCATLESFSEAPERWIDVGWEEDAVDMPRVGRIAVVIANEPGSL
ncbi:MAG TPA: bifunctional (p)ppGpp synthetase/guanosine-3',5'-bis(diphosphate) 3'-pyrophosphohydrolase, partial [Rhodospirillaceae bacterium]|nr:bifunctional (p)ppGpp synthetase/guanosine-3',5'-bis(diphosphate) 3'-pyrophosphohydrolase [Rhodospirillaceae bacterium]